MYICPMQLVKTYLFTQTANIIRSFTIAITTTIITL